MVPTQFMTRSVSMPPDPVAQADHFFNELVVRKGSEFVVGLHDVTLDAAVLPLGPLKGVTSR
jgi:hypothetical protein